MVLTDLSGFPMLMTVSQDAINAQMAKVYGQRTHDTDMFPHVPWNLGPEDSSWSLTVDQFAAPEVDFNTPVFMGCRLKMTIIKGHFSTYTVSMKTQPPSVVSLDTPLDGLTMFVTTPMQQLVHDTWSDEEFEVQALFADLENTHLVELDLSNELRIAIGGTIKSALETILSDRIKEIGQANPQALLFGAVKIPKIPDSLQSSGALAPSASTFSTTVIKNQGNYVSGDLNYLLLLNGNKDIPTGAAVGAFTHSFRLPDSPATLVLSDATVLEKFVIPALKKTWPGHEEVTIQFPLAPNGKITIPAVGPVNLSLDRGNSVAGMPAKAHLAEEYPFALAGVKGARLVKCDVSITGPVVRIDYEITSKTDHWSGDISNDTTGYETITFSFENGKLTQKVDAPEPHTATDSNFAGRFFGDALSLGFDEIGRKNTSNEGKDDIEAILPTMSTAVDNVFKTILLPGQAVFEFASAQVNGQLSIGASYK